LLIHEQSVIVEFEPDIAIASLPKLLVDPEERRKAVEIVEYIAGAIEEMEPGTLRMVQRFRAALGLSGLVLSALEVDPLPPGPEKMAEALPSNRPRTLQGGGRGGHLFGLRDQSATKEAT
jgi:hypothetical protein